MAVGLDAEATRLRIAYVAFTEKFKTYLKVRLPVHHAFKPSQAFPRTSFEDETLERAYAMTLINIGEPAKHLSESFNNEYPETSSALLRERETFMRMDTSRCRSRRCTKQLKGIIRASKSEYSD